MTIVVDKFATDFAPQNIKVLVQTRDNEVIASYNSKFKDRDYFHIRTLWRDDAGDWRPGKGLSVPADKGTELCRSLTAVELAASNERTAKAAKSSRKKAA